MDWFGWAGEVDQSNCGERDVLMKAVVEDGAVCAETGRQLQNSGLAKAQVYFKLLIDE
jgi:hypothetical protein